MYIFFFADANTKRYEPVLQNSDPNTSFSGTNENDYYDIPPPTPSREARQFNIPNLQAFLFNSLPYDPHCVINPIYQGSTGEVDSPPKSPSPFVAMDFLRLPSDLDEKPDLPIRVKTATGLSANYANIYENMSETEEESNVKILFPKQNGAFRCPEITMESYL